MSQKSVTADPWQTLRQFTDARIALGRAGVSLPTAPQLAFQLAHAKARDAVHLGLDLPSICAGFAAQGQSCITLHSAAADRNTYLQRPDLGRRLDTPSRLTLEAIRCARRKRPFDIVFVVADGLSALAIAQNALPFMQCVLPRLTAQDWSIAPIVIVEQGRVAVGDEVAELLRARMAVVLIGERPGLSSPDSMGLYLTWMPHVGLTDASRNCISNVRLAGLRYQDAADKLHYLLAESRRRQLSGVDLKEETGDATGTLERPSATS
jgi:ethanolamine ammonia-lyase small subunit